MVMAAILMAASAISALAQAPAELLTNGGFEQSKSLYPWVIETTKGGISVSGQNENGNPHGGNRYVVLGGTNKEQDSIEQTVIIPQNTAALVLSFALRIKATGNDKTPHDFFRISFKDETADTTLLQYSNVDACDWQVVSVPNLAAYAGRLITLRFEAETDGTKPTKFCIDDVSLVYQEGAGNATPNLEFMSPHYGCLYPISTVSGATPIRILTDSPDGIQSLTASIDGEVIATTTEPTLEIPVDWATLPPGEHTLMGELIDPIGRVIVKRCAVTSSNILEGADFENGGTSAWVGTSVDGNESLIRDIGNDTAYSGEGIAFLGTTSNSAERLEYIIGIPDDSQDTITLSFFYNTPLAGGFVKDNSLSVHLLDVDTGQDFLVATIYPSEAGWILTRTAISMAELGVTPGRDYILRFQANTASGTNYSAFYLDDVALYVYSNTLAAGAPLRDEDGDIPGQNTPGCSIVIPPESPHRDLPNTCNCGHKNHATVTINATWAGSLPQGNNISPNVLKVKFKFDELNTGVQAQNVCVSGTVITCTVPNASDKNKLGKAKIKVKVVSTNQKAWTDPYKVLDQNSGAQQGFFYGFPEPIRDVVLQSVSQVNVMPGDSFKVSARGLSNFYKMASGNCATDSTPGNIIRPIVFANEDGIKKVRVKKDSLKRCDNPTTPQICGCDTINWIGTWTGDGAPTVCSTDTPCISAGTPIRLVLLNPDNINPIADSNTGFPSGIPDYQWFKGELADAVRFIAPATTPSFTTGTGYGPANSVGYGGSCHNATNIALRPLSSASNYITFFGSNLYRIKDAYIDIDDTNHQFCLAKGPKWNETGWGTRFLTWAPAHTPGNVIPKVKTSDSGSTSYSAPALAYKASIAANGSTNCLTSPSASNCTWLVNNLVTPDPDFGPVENFMIGPQEPAITATATCVAGDCAKISVSAVPATAVIGGDDWQRQNASVRLNVSRQASTSQISATYAITPKSSYGNADTLSYTFVFPASGSGDLIVSAFGQPAGTSSLTVNFNSIVSGGCGSYIYSWTFGDGQSGTGNAPSHTYQTAGTYTATMTVTEASGGSCTGKTGSASVVVTVGSVLEVTASATPSTGNAPLSVNLSATASGGNQNYTYTWKFGDGQDGSGQTVTHVYSSAGSYTAKVTATDPENATGSASVEITVTSGSSLTIAATASPTLATKAPLTVTFSCNATGGTGSLSYLWDFDDGATTDQKDTTHTYTANGLYNATIYVYDAAGTTVSKTFPIKIGAIVH